MSNSIMKKLLKATTNPFASTILDNEIYKVETYFDSGNIMLNLMLSGKWNGGMPGGKILEITGDSQTGKSYLVMGMLLQHIRSDKNNYAILFESEAAFIEEVLRKTLSEEENQRFLVIPVSHHEDLGTYMTEQIEVIREIKKESPEINFFVALDSLGMLTPKQLYQNVIKGKDTKTMNEQQLIKSFFNLIKMPLAVLNVPFVYTNHIYLNFMDRFNSKRAEHNQKIARGGSAVELCPDIRIRLLQKILREKEGLNNNEIYINKSNDQLTDITGVNLKIVLMKSRQLAKEITKINMHLKFKAGLDNHSGIIEFLTDSKLIKKQNAGANGSKIMIPEINFEITTKELKGISKDEFWCENKLNYTEKKFNEFYALSSKDISIEESLEKNYEDQ